MPAPVDLAQPPPDLGHCCGQPGDPGNTLGVGKYCTSSSECAGQPANVCNGDTHYCTNVNCMTSSDCGAGAYCGMGIAGFWCFPLGCDLFHPPSC